MLIVYAKNAMKTRTVPRVRRASAADINDMANGWTNVPNFCKTAYTEFSDVGVRKSTF